MVGSTRYLVWNLDSILYIIAAMRNEDLVCDRYSNGRRFNNEKLLQMSRYMESARNYCKIQKKVFQVVLCSAGWKKMEGKNKKVVITWHCSVERKLRVNTHINHFNLYSHAINIIFLTLLLT